MKANKNRDKYEEDDGFYKELERRIAELIVENPEEVKPSCKLASSASVTKNSCRVITEKSSSTRLMVLDGRKYYDWSVCGRSSGGRPVFSYYPSSSSSGTGTGVFIPLIAHKFERSAANK